MENSCGSNVKKKNAKIRKKKEWKINPKKYKRLLRKEMWSDIRHLGLFIFLTFMIAGMIAAFGAALPLYEEFKESMFDAMASMNANTFLRAGNTDIYDSDGKLMGRIGNEKYEYVEISRISPYVTKGYIAKEDRNFSVHAGVDIKGTARAALSYLKTRRITQGGSTITQQVIKNNMLSQEQTFKRKFIEIFIAWDFEKEYSKTQIMEFYCNSNYYGNGCYGIEGASQYYFGHSAEKLTLAEAAMLVATSNSPNSYNPVVDYELSMKKKKDVLDDMMECTYITKEEYDKAVKEEPKIVKKSENVANENYMITYAIHCAALKLMAYDGFKFQYVFDSPDEYKKYTKRYDSTYEAAVSEIRTGGYTIKTSLNPKIQEIMQKSIDKGMKEHKEKTEDGIYTLQSAGVCVDNATGLVAAVVGGREAKGSYNRGYQTKRQPGSSIKPLIDYGPAYNEGIYTPASVLKDEPVNIDGYKPTNAWKGYIGDITTRNALLRSYNTIAVKTYIKTGKKTALSYLDKMRFSSMTYSDMIAPALAVGGFTVGVTPADMAKGYAAVAGGGKYVDNDCILSMISYDGKEIYKHNGKSYEVYNADTAFILCDILSGMFQEDFMPGSKFQKSSQVYMGKTGTTNNNKDAWFCGASPYYSASLWIGYDMPKEMNGIAGGTLPCQIWTSFMDSLHDSFKLEKKEFPVPDTIRLSNGNGTIKEVTYKTDVYKSRPDGYDYVSKILEKRREEELAKESEADYQKRAEKKVEEFEKFQITTVEEAQKVEELYNETFMMADKVADADVRTELLERIAYKYSLLSGDLTDKWAAAIEAYNKSLQIELNEQNGRAAELSGELAAEAEKNYKTASVKCYINILNSQITYSEIMETWAVAAKEVLEECIVYANEYSQLESQLNDAINRMRQLQEEYLENNAIDNAIPNVPAPPDVSEEDISEPEPDDENDDMPDENTDTGDNGIEQNPDDGINDDSASDIYPDDNVYDDSYENIE